MEITSKIRVGANFFCVMPEGDGLGGVLVLEVSGGLLMFWVLEDGAQHRTWWKVQLCSCREFRNYWNTVVTKQYCKKNKEQWAVPWTWFSSHARKTQWACLVSWQQWWEFVSSLPSIMPSPDAALLSHRLACFADLGACLRSGFVVWCLSVKAKTHPGGVMAPAGSPSSSPQSLCLWSGRVWEDKKCK